MINRYLADELYQYLLRLHKVLQDRGALTIAEQVRFASLFVSGSTTELYAEAQRVLAVVLSENARILTESELHELREVVKGIEAEFKLIGGA